MPKKPATIQGAAFKGDAALPLELWQKLECSSPDEAPGKLLNRWNGGIVAFTVGRLSNDNRRLDNLNLHLSGLLWEKEPLSSKAANFWPIEDQDIKLNFKSINANVFSFKEAGLVSQLIDSAELPFSFQKGGAPLEDDEIENLGLQGFCVRAFVQPRREYYVVFSILLFPLGKEDLLETHQLAKNPMFPGLLLYKKEIQLRFKTSDLFGDLKLGSPIVPAVIPGEAWTAAPNCPSATDLKRALACTLRAAFKPDAVVGKKKVQTLEARWSELLAEGESKLRLSSCDFTWPEAPAPRAASTAVEPSVGPQSSGIIFAPSRGPGPVLF